MPYTPPSQRSPVASRPETPNPARSQTHTKTQQQDASAGHTSKHASTHSPSSKSYLSKHRRSPSISDPTTPLAEPSTTKTFNSKAEIFDGAKSEREAAFLKTPHQDDARAAATAERETSPVPSPLSSSDDEIAMKRGRLRDVAKLAELQAAIRIIEQHRESSPNPQSREETNRARFTLGLPAPRLDPSAKTNAEMLIVSPKLSLSAGARKISHSRSSTEDSAFLELPRTKFDPASARRASDSDIEEDELSVKPSLIRKKSGELVRPALRASSTRRRPSSMPGTPTYSKAVHFQDNSLEHVRHFLSVDRPIAVSAGSSPVESVYEDDSDFPFGSDEPKSPPFNWEIRLTNFPRETLERSALPVRTERVYLSPDTKFLMGHVAVRNLSFHKLVVARFTLDYWKTTSEVVAEFDNDKRIAKINDGCDRFTFNIKLEDQANLENKTMFFCVRYNVNGQEYWDNNNSINYQIDFTKQYKPQNGKQGNQSKSSRTLNARSKQERPRSMPSFDDFASSTSPYDFSSFPQPSSMVGESPIRFRNRPSSKDIVPDAPSRPKSTNSQQAFGNRYDFGASLSAAMQTSTSSTSEKDKAPTRPDVKSEAVKGTVAHIERVAETKAPTSQPKFGEASNGVPSTQSKPTALTAEKPSLQSSSYHELLDKYCFVRSPGGKEKPQLVG